MADDDVLVEFPPEFLSLEEDFVESKIAINNSIHCILDEGNYRVLLFLIC